MKKGVSLLETIIVAFIIGIIASIILPSCNESGKKSRLHKIHNSDSNAVEVRSEGEIESRGYRGYVGIINVGGHDCVYLMGYHEGGISCDWNKSL